jgi:hypothetical protein
MSPSDHVTVSSQTKPFLRICISVKRATFLAPLIDLDLSTLVIFGEEHSYEVPHCVIFSVLTVRPSRSVHVFSLAFCSEI